MSVYFSSNHILKKKCNMRFVYLNCNIRLKITDYMVLSINKLLFTNNAINGIKLVPYISACICVFALPHDILDIALPSTQVW